MGLIALEEGVVLPNLKDLLLMDGQYNLVKSPKNDQLTASYVFLKLG